jgi:hypothetical protein
MIKYGFPVLIEPIIKLFNLIFEKGEFPKLWNESYITLLHKKGKKSYVSITHRKKLYARQCQMLFLDQ